MLRRIVRGAHLLLRAAAHLHGIFNHAATVRCIGALEVTVHIDAAARSPGDAGSTRQAGRNR